MQKTRIKKVGFAASSGGHFSQLKMLKPLMEQYDSFIMTEETGESKDDRTDGIRTYHLPQVNRKDKTALFTLIRISFQSLSILIREKPDAIVSTGVLATIPVCLLAKIMRIHVIYIESFAKIHTPTQTGKLMYHVADDFFVQWPSMLDVYPKAVYAGSLY